MPDCNYCDASFDDEGSYLDHLHADHDESELSRIDRRRVEDHTGGGDDEGFPVGPVIIGGLIVLAFGIIAYVVLVVNPSGSGPAAATPDDAEQTPYDQGAVHEHGTIEVVIDGEELDFSRTAFQNPRQYPAFHFEGGDGTTWHKHARGVTLGYAMSTLGIEVTESTVAYDGTTYDDADPDTTVTVEVNGEPVDPSEYVLQGTASEGSQDGDHIRIVVETEG